MLDISSNYFFAILLGLIIGSFAGVLADRLAIGRKVVFSRSACSQCDHRLGPLDLAPIVGWLALRGRCRYCSAPISVFYPLIEFSGAVVTLWAAVVFDGWLFWVSCWLGWTLLALAASDTRNFMLPDIMTLPLIVTGLGFSYAHDPLIFPHHVLGAALGFMVFTTVAFLYRKLRGREGLGLGDAKLMAGAGAWLGWAGLPSVVLWGGLSALAWAIGGRFVAGKKLTPGTALPFGPFLATGIWLVWLYGPFTLSLPFLSGF